MVKSGMRVQGQGQMLSKHGSLQGSDSVVMITVRWGVSIQSSLNAVCVGYPQCLCVLLLLLFHLKQQGAVDAWQNTAKSNGCTNKRVELFVSTDGKL